MADNVQIKRTYKSHEYTYNNSGTGVSNNKPIDPYVPEEELLSEDYIQHVLTSDLVSLEAAKGKIPISDPTTGRLRMSWIADQTVTTSLPIASEAEAKDPENNDSVMTPKATHIAINSVVKDATTSNKGIVQLTDALTTSVLNRSDLAITPLALKNYLAASGGFSHAGFNDAYGITSYASDSDVNSILSSSKTNTNSTLKATTLYNDYSITPYTLYTYVSNNDLTLNTGKNIVFSSRSLNGSTTAPTDIAKISVDRSAKSMTFTVDTKNVSIDKNGNMSVPGVVYSTVSSNKYLPPKLGNQTYGSATKPIYLNAGVITECNAIDNVSTATTATKLGSVTVGGTTQAIYLNLGSPTAINNKNFANALINSLDTGSSTPQDADYYVSQYAGGGTTTTTYHRRPVSALYSYIKGKTDTLYAAKSHNHDSAYLKLSGGTLSGPITVNTNTSYTVGASTPILSVSYKSTANKVMSTEVINVIGTNSSDAYNTPVSIGSDDGTTQIGAGESRKGFLGARELYNNENLYLTADGTINFYPGINNENTSYGGPMTISTAGSSSTGGKVNITGVNTIDGKAANVTGTVAITNGGTGATTRLGAAKALTNENVGTNATYFVTLTDSWGKFGYTSKANAQTVLGLGDYLKLTGGTMSGNISKKDTSITRSTAPSAVKAMQYYFLDSNGKAIGLFESSYNTDKTAKTAMYTYNTTAATGNDIGSIGIGCDTSGEVYTWAPTPADGDNSTKIATTEFVRSFVPSLSLNSGNGYLKLQSGAILQWGTTKIMPHMNTTLQVNFPTAFTEKVYSIMCTLYGNNVGSQDFSSGVDLEGAGGDHDKWFHVCVVYYDKNRFYVNLGDFDQVRYKVMWIAIGK